MMTLMYTDKIGNVFRHDTYCFSHLYDEEYFNEECDYMGIPMTLEDLRYITLVPTLPEKTYPELEAYIKLVKESFGDFLAKDGFALQFHPDQSKHLILFIANFLRPIEEEGEWFVHAMMKFPGSLIERLWAVTNDVSLMQWVNPQHQVMRDTITRLDYTTYVLFEEHWDQWLLFLEASTPSLLGSEAVPDYEASMDAQVTDFLEEINE